MAQNSGFEVIGVSDDKNGKREYPIIHTHSSGETGIFANAYLVETANGIVAIDATLTVSESKALRARLDSFQKPLLAVLITHGHPDHVGGIGEIISSATWGGAGREIPIVTLPSIETMMREIEEPKRAQWGPVYGEEWIKRWTYPNRLVDNNTSLMFDGLIYRVYDLGAGGDSKANALWLVELAGRPVAAFVGDLIFNGTHSYLADGHTLAWLANLERVKPLLANVPVIYPGHGASGGVELLDKQQVHLLTYCGLVKELVEREGSAKLTDQAKQELTTRMQQYLPGVGLSFLVGLSADAVAAELV